MLDLLLAAALLQAPDPCHVGEPAAAPAPCRQWREVALVRTAAGVDPCYAIGAPPSANCRVWQSIYRDSRAEMFMEPASLRPDGDGFQVRIRYLFPTAMADGSRTLVMYYLFDCRARTAARLGVMTYDQGGRRLQDVVMLRNTAARRPVQQGTPEMIVLAAICPR